MHLKAILFENFKFILYKRNALHKYAKADSKQKREALEKAYMNVGPDQKKSTWEGNNNLMEWMKSF